MGEHAGDYGTHAVIAVPVRKLDVDGIVAWRFSCSCGREGEGWHPTPEKAEAAGHCHIPDYFGSSARPGSVGVRADD